MPSATSIRTSDLPADDPDDPGSSPGADPEPPEPDEPSSASPFEVVVDPGLPADDVDAAWLRERVEAVLAHLDHPVARVSVRVVGDAAMADLHRRHCGLDSTTDVLTFDASPPDGPVETDIAVCLDVARRRAGELGHDPRRELLLYVVHGLLHCLGHDDHDQDAYAAMHAEEDRLLRAIGVGAVFRPDRDASAPENEP